MDGDLWTLHQARSGELAEPGFVWLRRAPAGLASDSLWFQIPSKVGKRLLQQLNARERKRIKAETAKAAKKAQAEVEGAGQKGGSSSGGFLGPGGFKRKGDDFVELPSPLFWDPPEGEGAAVEVFDADEFARVVQAHNSGSGDAIDRKRFANIFKSLAAIGPWRRARGPVTAKDARDTLLRVDEQLGYVADGRLLELVEGAVTRAIEKGEPMKVPAILLAGPPGTGKTFVLSALARIIDLQHWATDVSTWQTTSTLAGSDKHWSNSTTGALFNLILGAEGASADRATCNPVVLLDELDKASSSSRGYNTLAPLHGAMEAESAQRYRDTSVPDLTFDASHVSWVATANQLSPIPDSLLSRFTPMLVTAPGPAAALRIARSMWEQAAVGTVLQERKPPRDLLRAAASLPPRQMKRLIDLEAAKMLLEAVRGRPDGEWVH